MTRESLTCKLILLGNGSVGKSSFVERFIADGFKRVYKQTVGLDFFEKQVFYGSKNETSVKIQVWDIGGQNVGSKMLDKYIVDSQVILFCYDITDYKSFEDLHEWLQLTRKALSIHKAVQPHTVLVGNKLDVQHLRQVSEKQHDKLIREESMNSGCFVSAKTGDQVLTCVYRAAAGAHKIPVSAHDLAFTDKVVSATVVKSDNDKEEGRTDIADQIEAEDRALEEAKARRSRRSSLGRLLAGGSCNVQ